MTHVPFAWSGRGDLKFRWLSLLGNQIVLYSVEPRIEKSHNMSYLVDHDRLVGVLIDESVEIAMLKFHIPLKILKHG